MERVAVRPDQRDVRRLQTGGFTDLEGCFHKEMTQECIHQTQLPAASLLTLGEDQQAGAHLIGIGTRNKCQFLEAKRFSFTFDADQGGIDSIGAGPAHQSDDQAHVRAPKILVDAGSRPFDQGRPDALLVEGGRSHPADDCIGIAFITESVEGTQQEGLSNTLALHAVQHPGRTEKSKAVA